ncbi:smoothelin-like protein 1 [Sorex araneus]|uniref:smoothelin-like protein 1 n=1 Tax=Sorex araneus TaxID=42254 RepID=UPI002433E455|nr:smoothelin-like protein 1 [Sorex araneus]
MEQKEAAPCEDGTAVSPCTEAPGAPGDGVSAEPEAKDSAGRTSKVPSAEGKGAQDRAPAENGPTAESPGDGNGQGEAKAEAGGSVGAGLPKEDGSKEEESTAAPEDTSDSKDETQSATQEAPTASDEKAPEKEASPKAKEADVNEEPRTALGEQDPAAGTPEKAKAPAAPADSEKTVVGDTQAQPKEEGSPEEVKPDGPHEEQAQGVEKESEEGAGGVPSSPEVWPESPTEEGFSLSPDGLSPDAAASGQTSPSASESSASDVPQSPTEPPPAQEKKKEKAPERRASAPSRPRGARAQNRKAIVDKFGGAASGTLFRNPKAAGAAIGSVKSMLLEWCRAMTRNYEHVDIQNFSSSWSSGMAFCALIHKFFPDAFDYAALDPAQRRHNFTLAFSTAETLADCAQLLEVDDMVRLAVPDSKCVYTYIQELYRSLVQKGLVKTKKK